MLQNIVLLFITMAADNSATGHRGSQEMNSFMQKDTHRCQSGGRSTGLTCFFGCFFFLNKGNFYALDSAQPSEMRRKDEKFDSVFF